MNSHDIDFPEKLNGWKLQTKTPTKIKYTQKININEMPCKVSETSFKPNQFPLKAYLHIHKLPTGEYKLWVDWPNPLKGYTERIINKITSCIEDAFEKAKHFTQRYRA